MLLQRLTADDEIGYNYDYMGAAEYENGATLQGRIAIADLFIDGKLEARKVMFEERLGRMKSKPVEVLAMGTRKTLDSLGDPMTIPVTNEAFRTDRPGVVGWLHVPRCGSKTSDFEGLLIVRTEMDGEGAVERVQKFLAGAIHAIREGNEVKPIREELKAEMPTV